MTSVYVIQVWKFDYRYKIGRRYVESYCIDNLDDKNKQEFVAKLRKQYQQYVDFLLVFVWVL